MMEQNNAKFDQYSVLLLFLQALSCGVLASFSISLSLASSLPSPLSSLITLLTFFALSLTPPLLVEPSIKDEGQEAVATPTNRQEAVAKPATPPPSLEVTTVCTAMGGWWGLQEDPGKTRFKSIDKNHNHIKNIAQ